VADLAAALLPYGGERARATFERVLRIAGDAALVAKTTANDAPARALLEGVPASTQLDSAFDLRSQRRFGGARVARARGRRALLGLEPGERTQTARRRGRDRHDGRNQPGSRRPGGTGTRGRPRTQRELGRTSQSAQRARETAPASRTSAAPGAEPDRGPDERAAVSGERSCEHVPGSCAHTSGRENAWISRGANAARVLLHLARTRR
jgi:hypothetical protein